MKKKPIYAVVDIETTGTDPQVDRIIQFGCVLIEDGEIVTRFSTDVNPGKSISPQIQHLTGITNKQVTKAPYFEDIALTIHHLLAETVFVAHNIYFDYSFLNQELQRCGAPELSIPGIDTVELSQIFFPTEKSFRLSDLSESLGLVHDNPHQADSDAQVTAEVFLLIEKKIRALPLLSLKTILSLSDQLGMETGTYLNRIYEEMKEHPDSLRDDLKVVEGLVLKKKQVTYFETPVYETAQYPATKRQKERVFAEALTYRKEQSRMMNDVYKHFTAGEEKNLFIEAATGIGKTFGYLFPSSYFAEPKKPVIVSTVSIMLQNQLYEKDIPFTNQFAQQKLQATVLKSHRHYLDLQRFNETLKNPIKQKQYALYQMRVLVWLLETETGDLDELQLINFNHIFWRDTTHRGTELLKKDDSLYHEDFVRFLYKRAAQSNLLIVNHAFLMQESFRKRPLLPEEASLIIDEAHHLPDIVKRTALQTIPIYGFQKQVIQAREEGQLFDQVLELLGKLPTEKRYVNMYSQTLLDVVEDLKDFAYELAQILTIDKREQLQESVIQKTQFDQLSLDGEKLIRRLETYLSDLEEIQQSVRRGIQQQLESFSVSERMQLTELFQLFSEVSQLAECFDIFVNQWEAHWVKEYRTDKKGLTVLAVNDLSAGIIKKASWYPNYQHILYTGGTLVFGKNRHYLPNKLGVNDFSVKVLPDPYNYEQAARLYVPKLPLAIHEVSDAEFAEYISQTVEQIAKQEDRPILVLFTSHEVLKKTYHQLHQPMLNVGREVMAQGISGTREKLLKRFYHSKNSILLGADSFWEGVDLPGDSLQLLIVTRLPFENPNRPLVKAEYEYLEAQGINSFTGEALPKASMRLRQALGRLIRSENDHGVLLVLDRRLVRTKYGKRMLRALPKKLPIEDLPLEETLQSIHEFFKEKG
ncbi:helicase C-terminal domain-containing protein [Enterococcus sp. BWR-S5]|uniref:helicase C-terminal domain-containing protein n=1 Tax=Enterococcus sp. BWR-S5 TaxID=2787714 RepID=UPI001921CAE9|nr:helicase C-terminal domain-containing protein [Enterococcus sp. BWR-S5]MBL1225648.1 DEAD/DEAH box helicase family protein [Enterococcus sp. BWR-S5]